MFYSIYIYYIMLMCVSEASDHFWYPPSLPRDFAVCCKKKSLATKYENIGYSDLTVLVHILVGISFRHRKKVYNHWKSTKNYTCAILSCFLFCQLCTLVQEYSKFCVKWPLKNKQNKDLNDKCSCNTFDLH